MKKYNYIKILLLVCLFIFIPVFAYATNNLCTVSLKNNTLGFTAPSVNTNGTPLTDLAGFKVYFGTATGVYSLPKDIVMDSVTTTGGPGTVLLSSLNLVDGTTYFIAMTAYDKAGLESPFSNEISCTFDSTTPNAPTGLILKP